MNEKERRSSSSSSYTTLHSENLAKTVENVSDNIGLEILFYMS